MLFSDHSMKTARVIAWFPVALTAISISVMVGCAAGGYGRLSPDTEVTRMFTQNSVPEYYRYYTNGRTDMPYAIIGIDPRYRIESKIWQPVAANIDEFADKVSFIWVPHIWEQWNPAQGAWIVAPDGEKIGIWYSMYPYATIKVEKDNRVMIPSPHNPGRE